MDDLTAKTITAGSSGLLGALLAWAGLRTQIKEVRHDIDRIDKNVMFTVTCKANTEGMKTRLSNIEDMQKVMMKDIKELLKGGA